MNQYWFEDLKFAVEVFDQGGNLVEVLARLRDLVQQERPMARAG